MSEHTPAPWHLDEYGNVKDANNKRVVVTGLAIGGNGYPESVPNTAYIVTAVNSNSALVEALRAIVEHKNGPYAKVHIGLSGEGTAYKISAEYIAAAARALALAEEQTK